MRNGGFGAHIDINFVIADGGINLHNNKVGTKEIETVLFQMCVDPNTFEFNDLEVEWFIGF